MNNLFVLHTQYNLILGSGIALSMMNDNNILVLYAEFPVSDIILANLKMVFSEIIIVRDHFEKDKTRIAEAKEIRSYLKKTKHLEKIAYDRIFLAQERRFDTLLAYRCSKRKKPEFICVEEDAYYSICPDRKVPKRTWKTYLGDVLRFLICGNNPYFSTSIPCYGSNEMYSVAYLLFPKIARSELKNKQLCEVSSDMLYCGIEALYADIKTEYPEGDKYLLLFFDLMDRYRDKEKIKELIRTAVSAANKNGYTVLAKYHPRENEKFTDLLGITEINQVIPGEKILADLKDKSVTVLGNATTVCTVAAKLKQRVFSVAKLDHPRNCQMHEAMRKMGISLLEDSETIRSFLS